MDKVCIYRLIGPHEVLAALNAQHIGAELDRQLTQRSTRHPRIVAGLGGIPNIKVGIKSQYNSISIGSAARSALSETGQRSLHPRNNNNQDGSLIVAHYGKYSLLESMSRS